MEEQRKEKEKSTSGKRRGKGAAEGKRQNQATVLDEQDDAFATLGKLLNEAGRSLWRRLSQRAPSSSAKPSLPAAPSIPDISPSTHSSTASSSKKGTGSNGLRRLSSVSNRAKKPKKKHIIADELANPTILEDTGGNESDADDDEKKTTDVSGSWKSSKRAAEDPMTKTIRIDSDDEEELGAITAPARLTAKDVHALEENITARCDIEDDILVGHSPSLDLERAHGEIHSPTTVEVHIVAEDQ